MKIKPGCTVQEHNPELIPLWSSKNTLKPNEISYGSNKIIYLICKKHGDYPTSSKNAVRGRRCPTCSHRSTPPFKESLGYLNTELISQWSSRNSITAYEVWPSSHYKALWICPIHGEYEQTCANKSRGKGCKKCGYMKTGKYNSNLVDKNRSLAVLYPSLLKEYSSKNSKDPYTLYPQSNYRAKWVCNKGHKWETELHNRTSKGSSCPHCCNNQTSNAENFLRSSLTASGALPTPHKIGPWTVDIFFPDSKTIVEYDGAYYHSFPGAYERDKRKSVELLQEGYKVIRVRTYSKAYSLSSLAITSSNYFEVFCEEPLDSEPTEELLKEILNATP